MKQISIAILLLIFFVFNQGDIFSADLDSNVMRRIDAANQELDQAEEHIRNSCFDHAPGKLKSAKAEYENILNYYDGTCDQNDPTLVKLKERIDEICSQLPGETKHDDRIMARATFPGDSYNGGDLEQVRGALTKAIVGPVAISRDEILKVAVTSEWREGVYTDTQKLYRKISGTVLWHDKTNDSICRFSTYSFISDYLGGDKWTQPRYKCFTAEGLEGDTECP